MIVLQIVTLGFYEFYWLAVQKKYVERTTKDTLPSTNWLIVAAVLMFIYFVFSVWHLFIPGDDVKNELITLSLIVLFGFASIIIHLIWSIFFYIAANKIIGDRVKLVWLIVYLITFRVSSLIAQFYANRKPNPKTKVPSTRFITISVVLLAFAYIIIPIIVTIGMVFYIGQAVYTTNAAIESDALYQEYDRKAIVLDKQYAGCLEALDEDFPVVAIDDTEAKAYLAAYDACEDIRLEQNKAVDDRDARYDELFESSWEI